MIPEREKYVYDWLVSAFRIANAIMLAACITSWLYLLALQAGEQMKDRVIQQMEQSQ